MARKDFWKSDWFLGVAVAVVVLVLSRTDLVQSLERKAYDLGVRASSRLPSERIAVIAIDETSIANIGRWPWPRDVHAKLVDGLNAAHAKMIGYTVFFSEPQLDPGLPYIAKLRELFGLLSPAGNSNWQSSAACLTRRNGTRYRSQACRQRGSASNVVLPILFRHGDPVGKPIGTCRSTSARTPFSTRYEGPLPVPAANVDTCVDRSPADSGTTRKTRRAIGPSRPGYFGSRSRSR